ncbi:beta-ribofuranosylaminobenzene 5'-phosphate synthase family protein [Methylococcus sp. EFPC2]|uniref:beta-ribofuranosylaminobenzene 5'-phosphate synthase family protein n=1 Tax=Methylococcus sp. EFPC2 TaxID=2812648 RepID=UPI0019671673|nr:beta-ribofuranosylaminobenzene 5'-phosphate synthase family protein [Methylococcus sp. EFPC2]QSA96731.1 GHMP kinase [Methylococcus sp. EFPC2]
MLEYPDTSEITQPVVSIEAPARLHMGFIDLGGSLGRKFGSIGVGINEVATRLSVRRAESLCAEGPGSERALKVAREFAERMGVDDRISIRIHQAIPEHVGLGSGTQLTLALGTALARLHGLNSRVRELAGTIERGARSGIGIAVFEQGGLVVDGGRGPDTVVPPVIARLEMPGDWRFILAFDRRGKGLHGVSEVAAFAELPPFPPQQTARLCHLLLMQALPALAEGDLAGFGAVITELQSAMGDHFAPAQGGRFTSPEVGAAMADLQSAGAVAIGQSSWGPTGFCLVESAARAAELIVPIQARWPDLDFLIASPRNRGAEVRLE